MVLVAGVLAPHRLRLVVLVRPVRVIMAAITRPQVRFLLVAAEAPVRLAQMGQARNLALVVRAHLILLADRLLLMQEEAVAQVALM